MGVKAVLLASNALPAKQVQQLTQLLFSSREGLEEQLGIPLDPERNAVGALASRFMRVRPHIIRRQELRSMKRRWELREIEKAMKIELDMFRHLAVAVLVLMLGKFLQARCGAGTFLHSGSGHWRVLFAIFNCVAMTGAARVCT